MLDKDVVVGMKVVPQSKSKMKPFEESAWKKQKPLFLKVTKVYNSGYIATDPNGDIYLASDLVPYVEYCDEPKKAEEKKTMKATVKNVCETSDWPAFTPDMTKLIGTTIEVVKTERSFGNHQVYYIGGGYAWLPEWLEFCTEKKEETKTMKAIVKDFSCAEDPYNLGTNSDMKALVGKTIEVKPAKGRSGIYYQVDGIEWSWDENWLDFCVEPISEKKKEVRPATKFKKGDRVVCVETDKEIVVGTYAEVVDVGNNLIAIKYSGSSYCGTLKKNWQLVSEPKKRNHWNEEFEVEVNEAAKTVTVIYSNGDRFAATCQPIDVFDAGVGMRIAIANSQFEKGVLSKKLREAEKVC